MRERVSGSLLDEATVARMPELTRVESEGLEAQALARFYILDDRYWTFYPTAFDGKDLLFGLVVTPDGLELTYRTLSELKWVNDKLDLAIERDPALEPISLRELTETHPGYATHN